MARHLQLCLHDLPDLTQSAVDLLYVRFAAFYLTLRRHCADVATMARPRLHVNTCRLGPYRRLDSLKSEASNKLHDFPASA